MAEAAPRFPRYLVPRLREALADKPTVLVHGPRQCGKTTLARLVGEPRGYRYVSSFDDEAVATAARADPFGFVSDLSAHTILDEVQRVPATALHREAVPCRVQHGCGRPPRARAGRPHHRRRIAARFALPVGAVVSLEPNTPTSRTARWCRRSPVGYQVLHFNNARHHPA